MESLFFNTPKQRYQISELFNSKGEYLRKVDISNGIFFYDVSLKKSTRTIRLKNLDRMLIFLIVKSGDIYMEEFKERRGSHVKENSITIYGSTRQDFSFKISGEVFMLFVADFFLKQYLSFDKSEPIDFLYEKIQGDFVLEKINQQPLDALSLYFIEKIVQIDADKKMQSLRCMHRIIEFMVHRFSLLDRLDETIDEEELRIATRAKEEILRSFIAPPTIEQLAHLCATNESKLKKVFKRVYKSTIYTYVQRLRLEEANLLLREECMTIGEVAKRVGYKHQGHFSKLFFGVYGVYPKDLLKRG